MNRRGQTTIEYILVISVIAALLSSIYPIIKDRLIGEGTCNESNPAPILCKIMKAAGLDNGYSNTYRDFTLRKIP